MGRCWTFNLSILECKYKKVNDVNIEYLLLISPYWNVNHITCRSEMSIVEAFNLSILECKFWLPVSVDPLQGAFNLSILECKCQGGRRGVLGHDRF